MRLFVLFIVFLTSFSCSRGDVYNFRYKKNKNVYTKILNLKKINPPDLKIILISDLHFYDSNLGTTGEDFEKYIDDDRKLLVDSENILREVIKQINDITADIVIIPGDLTKDGEKINHEKVSSYLGKIEEKGKKVYVINGNHDIYNGHSFKYSNTGKEIVENVSDSDFKNIYGAFGYDEAIEKDKFSLSYVVEPKDGIWILALDSCLWRSNVPNMEPIVDGEFRKETLDWIEDILIRANENGKYLICFMHHGVLEHYKKNEKFYGEYIVNNNNLISEMLAFYNVHLVFSGHFHSQDITSNSFKFGKVKKILYDVETGSIVTYPCPYRICLLNSNGTIDITSRFITSIDTHKDNFQKYAHSFVFKGTINMAMKVLRKYKVPEVEGLKISEDVANAYIAHLKGDEKPPRSIVKTKGLSLKSRFVIFFKKDLLIGWWNDLPPEDNDTTLLLNASNNND